MVKLRDYCLVCYRGFVSYVFVTIKIMTVREALNKKIKKIRLPHWADGCYVELPEGNGVWVKINDPYSGNSEITIFEFLSDGSEEWSEVE